MSAAIRRSGRLAGALVAVATSLALVACGGGDDGGGDTNGGDAGGEVTAEISAIDNAFEPASLTLPAGSNTIEITNDGAAVHNFVIADQDVDSDLIQPGESATVTVDVPAGGIDFVCTLHPEMTGTIEVES